MAASALERLAELAADTSKALDVDALAEMAKVASELSAALATPGPQTASALADAAQALSCLPRSFDCAERVHAALTLAQHQYVAARAREGLDPAAHALEVARRIESRPLVRKALTFEGILLADTGNLPGAIERCAEALEIAEALQDPVAEAAVWNNLGAALLYAAQYNEAIRCFERVLALSETEVQLQGVRAGAFGNIALACLYLEDFGKGLRNAKASVDIMAEPSTPTAMQSRVLAESNYTRLLLEVDSLTKAKERCEFAKHYAKQSGSERTTISASIAEGLYEVSAGMHDVGLSRLNQTLERARVLRSPLRDALIAMVKAHEIAGKPDLALVYLRELMLHTKKLHQDNALHHHRLHLERVEQKHAALAASPEALMARREQSLRGKLAEQVAQQELTRSRVELLERLAVTAELRDDATGEHSYRVGRLSSLLAHDFGCDEQTCFMIDLAARLHDIGKIGIPDGILLKPEKLNGAERQMMQTHATVGAELLAKSDVPHMQMAEDIARFHHEWWDGSGYPFGIGGTAIPLSARIAALADVFDALTHRRPYKEAWPVSSALEEMASLKGKQFDPQLSDLFLALVPRLQREVGDLDEYLAQAARLSPFIKARQKISATLRQFTNARFDDQR